MIITFWRWFFRGAGSGRPGALLLFRWSLMFHAVVAAFFAKFLNADPYIFAGKALFPAASILVSMAVAWTTRASVVLQDGSFRENILGEDNPLEEYVYGYQLSLLIIMIMVSYVAIMAGGGLDINLSYTINPEPISAFFLYFFLSLSVAQCWQVIDFSNLLSLLHDKVKRR